jgi:hypothetical protein
VPNPFSLVVSTAVAGLVSVVPGLALSACSTSARTEAAADSPSPTGPGLSASAGGLTSNGYGHTHADFARVGLKRDTVAVWEDGFRTAAHNDDPNVFEWWYADFTGDDGTVVPFTLSTRLDDGFVPVPGEAGRKPKSGDVVTHPDEAAEISGGQAPIQTDTTYDGAARPTRVVTKDRALLHLRPGTTRKAPADSPVPTSPTTSTATCRRN